LERKRGWELEEEELAVEVLYGVNETAIKQ
jgi:hypothetical protein